MKNILLFGVPTALNEVMVNLAMLTVSGVANSFGLVSSAAYGVGSRINSLAIFTDGAMNQTMSAYASQNIGAGRQKRALEGLWKAILQDIVGMSFFLIYIVVNIFHKWINVEM